MGVTRNDVVKSCGKKTVYTKIHWMTTLKLYRHQKKASRFYILYSFFSRLASIIYCRFEQFIHSIHDEVGTANEENGHSKDNKQQTEEVEQSAHRREARVPADASMTALF